MILETILFLSMFHHKKKPVPADPVKEQLIKSAMEAVVSAGDLVYKIEHESSTANMQIEVDLIAKSKSDIELSMNTKDFDKFLDKVDDVCADVDQLVSIDVEMSKQDII